MPRSFFQRLRGGADREEAAKIEGDLGRIAFFTCHRGCAFILVAIIAHKIKNALDSFVQRHARNPYESCSIGSRARSFLPERHLLR